jgi:hypothetical protein
VRRRLLGNVTGADPIACLLAAPQRERREWNQPLRQDREGLPAWATDPAPYPETLVSVIVRLPESTAVAEDRPVMADRTQPRQ